MLENILYVRVLYKYSVKCQENGTCVANFLESLKRFERIKVRKTVEIEFLQLETHIRTKQHKSNQTNKNPVSIGHLLTEKKWQKKKINERSALNLRIN